MSKLPVPEIPEHSPGKEFLGVTAIAATLFAIVSLVTYNPQDPSFNHRFSGEEVVTNQGGMVGAFVSDGLVQTFGAGAFFFPLVTFLVGWALLRGGTFSRWPIVLGSGVVFLVCLCSQIAVHFTRDPVFHEASQPGGIVGAMCGGVLALWLNSVGATLLLTTLMFLSLMTLTGVSVNTVIDGTARLFRNSVLLFSNTMLKLLTAWREFRERRKISALSVNKTPKREISEPVIVTRTSELPTLKVKEPKKKKEKEPETFPVQEDFPFVAEMGEYQLPPLSLLKDPPPITNEAERKEEILLSATILEKKLADFGIMGKVVQVLPGPVITLYEFEPASGIKVSRILALTDDLALAMRAPSVRFLAPVPGKPVVGIEIPNTKRETVSFKEIISCEAFTESGSKMELAIGKDHIGEPVVQDLTQVPHLLIAGSTGSGKSVGINAMICSLLINATPDEVKLIMIDPKMLELSMYDGIPHLISPVVTNPKKAAAALQWAVQEMEQRYKLMAETGVRNIRGFNDRVNRLRKEREAEEKRRAKQAKSIKPADAEDEDEMEEPELPPIPDRLPYIVIVIDELADLMMVASKGVEEALARLAQMARASGIHMIVATQRPSVDVLTGLIKANFPARISYQVTSRVDSRTILDSIGAERLLGKGDMLFIPPGTAKLRRIHGAMLSDDEINAILQFIKKQKRPDYQEEDFVPVEAGDSGAEADDEEMDEKYDEAVALVAREQQASISMVQRRLRVGYNRAARMIEIMEKEGVVGPSDGVKPREVYVKPVPLD